MPATRRPNMDGERLSSVQGTPQYSGGCRVRCRIRPSGLNNPLRTTEPRIGSSSIFGRMMMSLKQAPLKQGAQGLSGV